MEATLINQVPKTLRPDPAGDPRIERRTRDFLRMLNAAGGKPMEEMEPEEARAVLTGAQNSVEVDLSGVTTDELTISQGQLQVRLFVVRPEKAVADIPAFMFFHGGGWVLGDFPTHRRFIRDIVIHSGAAAVYVDYSRSPEARYPQALNECVAATQWIAALGHSVGIDGRRIALVGNSAGGNLVAATALRLLHEGGPAVRLQLLFWPVTDGGIDTESYEQFAEGRFLTRNMMRWFWNNYSTDPAAREEMYASPLKAPAARLRGLPPTYVQTAENDVLRDEGEAYARRLDEAGVDVTLVRVQGMIHDYGLLNPLATVPAVQAALRAAAAELRNALA